MKRIRWITLLILLSVLAAANPAPKFTKVRITFMLDGKAGFYNPPRKYVISDPAKIDALVACFVGLGAKSLPLKPAGWRARAMVELFPSKGPSTMVYVGFDYVTWSVRGSFGDAKAKGPLKPIMEDAEKLSKPLG